MRRYSAAPLISLGGYQPPPIDLLLTITNTADEFFRSSVIDDLDRLELAK